MKKDENLEKNLKVLVSNINRLELLIAKLKFMNKEAKGLLNVR